MSDPVAPSADPHCKECGCQIGGGEYCYQHRPYTVWPLADGSFRCDRNGMKHIWLEEPPSFESDPPVASGDPWEQIKARIERLCSLNGCYGNFNENCQVYPELMDDWCIYCIAERAIKLAATERQQARAREATLQAEIDRLKDVIVQAYEMARNNWSAQCFDFTSAPESMRRSAHEVGREGMWALYTLLGSDARPVLKEEYMLADECAKLKTRAEKAEADLAEARAETAVGPVLAANQTLRDQLAEARKEIEDWKLHYAAVAAGRDVESARLNGELAEARQHLEQAKAEFTRAEVAERAIVAAPPARTGDQS